MSSNILAATEPDNFRNFNEIAEMESPDDEDDLKLVKASAGLLNDLEASLPKLLWKRSKTGTGHGPVHKWVKHRDLEYVIRLIEPFQGEPQLLDARLKYVLPLIVNAYIEYLGIDTDVQSEQYVDIQSAICRLLYTLCKVRGSKVIVGFLNNEPRYLEPILHQIESAIDEEGDGNVDWQVPYVLLLWLSHLMLTPFDLKSMSPPRAAEDLNTLPTLAERTLNIAMHFLASSTKAQEAAAALLLRLAIRPDMAALRHADNAPLKPLLQEDDSAGNTGTIYKRLGSLRFFAGCASSIELSDIIPMIYRHSCSLIQNQEPPIASNAVAKKLIIKISRNTVVTALRSAPKQTALLPLLTETSIVEDVIDHLLRSLGDRDTPVRYAAAKALSRLVLELESEMGHQVVQAVLDSFKEDMPKGTEALDFRTADALKWHGLTLALAHILFKRSAVPNQLPDIVAALVSALQFEQRTATGSSVGTNVRDAANFGLWALSRRYTTAELLEVDKSGLSELLPSSVWHSIIQAIAIQLVATACLDPVGNIRRGASAALQELVGRHPDQVLEGIALVQIVEYLAVSLRRRAMVDVASGVADLADEKMDYWSALVYGILGWRGIRSPDVASRESAAAALSQLSKQSPAALCHILSVVKKQYLSWNSLDAEARHGVMLSMGHLLDELYHHSEVRNMKHCNASPITREEIQQLVDLTKNSANRSDTTVLRSEQPVSVARFLTAVYKILPMFETPEDRNRVFAPQTHSSLDDLTWRLVSRYEESLQPHIPPLIKELVSFKQKVGEAFGVFAAVPLCNQVAVHGSKSTLEGACRAIALGTISPLYESGLEGDDAVLAVSTLAGLMEAPNVDWRIVGVKALRSTMENFQPGNPISDELAETLVSAIHRGLNDYTIDERGDIGSLVRLQAIACTSSILQKPAIARRSKLIEILHADIYRLSLEKLDRVRLEAAHCRVKQLGLCIGVTDVASVSSKAYFSETLAPLGCDVPDWQLGALLEGCISSAGIASESLLQAARPALVLVLSGTNDTRLLKSFSIFADTMKSLLLGTGNNMHSALELVAFLFDMQLLQRLVGSGFKWRNLLSTVQKSHHKSNDIPKILAAVQVYRAMGDIPDIRSEVLKKLVSILKTNPYPKVRLVVAEAVFMGTGDHTLKEHDWTKPASANSIALKAMQERYVGS